MSSAASHEGAAVCSAAEHGSDIQRKGKELMCDYNWVH